MEVGKIVALVLFFCCMFQCVVSTGLLINAIKNSIQNTRCKLHTLGSKIVEHDHQHANPCPQPNVNGGDYGVNGNNNFDGANNYQRIEKPYEKRPDGYGKPQYPTDYGTSFSCNFNRHCPPQLSCIRYKCQDPCIGVCGYNTQCSVTRHVPFCSCIAGYRGDPFVGCSQDVQPPRDHQQGQIFNGHSYGPLNGDELDSTTSTTNRNFNSVSTERNNNFDQLIDDIFEKNDNSTKPIDNFLTDTTSDRYKTSSSKPPRESQNFVSQDISEKPNINNNPDNAIDHQEHTTSTLAYDIDVRLSSQSKLAAAKAEERIYANVPDDGGRHIINANCPNGKIATQDGECLDDF